MKRLLRTGLMNKPVTQAFKLGLVGIFCLQISPLSLAQEKAASDTDGQDEASQETDTTAEAAAPVDAEDLPPTGALPLADDTLPLLEGDLLGPDLKVGESETYWMPEADPTAPSNSSEAAGMAPIDLQDETAVSPIFQEEELEETALYQNPLAMAGTYSWAGEPVGAGGFAPTGLPSGFNTPPAVFPVGGRSDGVLGGFSLSANLSGIYDSNVTQSGGAGGGPTDDFITSLGGSLSYMSRARVWTFGGNYSGAYNLYANNSDFNGYTQSGGLVANYNGAKLSASLTAGLSTGRGGNRNLGTSAFVEQTQTNISLAARYVYSPKTIISADAGHSFSTASGGNFSDTTSTNLGLAALWKYSPLTEFGPGIRFTRASGGGSNDRTTIGPTLNLNYRYSSKLSLNSTVGLDFADYSQAGSSDSSVSASVGLNYRASALWGMNLALFRDAQADPSVAGAFRETTAIRLGYTRKIRRASLGLGISYETSTTSNDQVVGTRPDRDYFSIDGSIGMSIFANTTNASLFMRYSDQSAGNTESYDALQTGFMLSRGF